MKFITDPQRLVIKLEGLEVFFSLRLKIAIPKQKINSIDWSAEFTFPNRMWRIFGSGMPGLLDAGIFRGGGSNYYLYLKKPKGVSLTGGPKAAKNVLVISTNDYRYGQVFVTATKQQADELAAWLHS